MFLKFLGLENELIPSIRMQWFIYYCFFFILVAVACGMQVPGADSPAAIHMENEFRYEATGQRYVPNEEGLTLASYINHPRQLFAKAVGVLDLESDDVPHRGEGPEGGVAMDMEGTGDSMEATGQNQGAHNGSIFPP